MTDLRGWPVRTAQVTGPFRRRAGTGHATYETAMSKVEVWFDGDYPLCRRENEFDKVRHRCRADLSGA
jgi:hypothetical protein